MFDWLKRKPIYAGPLVDLHQDRICDPYPGHPSRSIIFSITLHEKDVVIGDCDLRIGESEELYYAGNIGYNIRSKYRGNGYAYQACVILLAIAKETYHMNRLIITCSPENEASKKTIEKLGGHLLETVDVPENHWLYKRGETRKCIYSFLLDAA